MQFVSMQLCWIPLLKAKQYHKITTNCPFVVSQGMFKRFVQQFNEIIYPSQTNIACQWPKQFNGFASKSIWLSSVLPLMIFFANLGSPIILLLIFPGTPIDLGAHFIHGVCPEHPIACIAKDGWDDAGEGVLLRCKHFFSTAIKREGLHEQFAHMLGGLNCSFWEEKHLFSMMCKGMLNSESPSPLWLRALRYQALVLFGFFFERVDFL